MEDRGGAFFRGAYICGPLTELPAEVQVAVKKFYKEIADMCKDMLGVRAFVPHEHYDPVVNANFTPKQVNEAERKQICEKTSVLIVVAIAPSWGGGIEVEMAHQSKVPIIILCEREKLKQRKISRLLLGNPGVVKVIPYSSQKQALDSLGKFLQEFSSLFIA